MKKNLTEDNISSIIRIRVKLCCIYWIFLGMILLVMAVFFFTGYAATKDWQLPLAISLVVPVIAGGLRLFELITLYKGYLESGRRYSSADYAVPCDKGQPQGILGLGL